MWTPLLPFLSRRYVVYALDLPGFGKPPLAPEGVNVALMNFILLLLTPSFISLTELDTYPISKHQCGLRVFCLLVEEGN